MKSQRNFGLRINVIFDDSAINYDTIQSLERGNVNRRPADQARCGAAQPAGQTFRHAA
jgi:hypothetical protein